MKIIVILGIYIHDLMHGGGIPNSGELHASITYLSVFITHFLIPPLVNPPILRNLYLNLQVSHPKIEEISEDSWSRTSIHSALKKHGFKRKQLSSNAKYGEKIVSGLHVPHLGEQKIIKKMLSLRKAGKSLKQVAKELNQQGFTKRSGGKWDITTIAIILKREQEKQEMESK